jgi:hypothetical protein
VGPMWLALGLVAAGRLAGAAVVGAGSVVARGPRRQPAVVPLLYKGTRLAFAVAGTDPSMG